MKSNILHADFLVAGGGMAGVCAAIAASRQGAKVILIQDRSVLGGNASSEVRMHIVGADCHGGRKGWRESGLIEELRLEDASRNPTRCYPFWDVLLYEKVVAEPNITLLLDTDLVGVEMDYGNPPSEAQRPPRTDRMYQFQGKPARIKSVKAVRQHTEDEFLIHAQQFADCTGDGRLGFEAGADFRIGRESREMHGESLAMENDDVHTLGNSILITSRRYDHPVPFRPPPWARKLSPELLKVGRGINSWEYGFWWAEWGGMLDTIKDNCTTIRHELYAIALGIWDYIKNSGRYPDSANWALDWIGAMPGKRESRRFLGLHILTQQDVQQRPVFPDEVAYGGWAIDIHPPGGMDDIHNPPYTPTRLSEVYGIPLRCYFSRNIENLFFAGRNISATHVAFASTRVMATCAIGGEAVGVAAAYCISESLSPAQLVAKQDHLSRLQQQLLRNDTTLLNVRPEQNLVHSATIHASSCANVSSIENVRSGHTRDALDSKTGDLLESRGWRSEPSGTEPEWVEFRWKAPVKISEIHLFFDSGFVRELILSPSTNHTSKTVRGPQPETVRDYCIELDGKTVESVEGNYQRKRVHRWNSPQTTCALKILVKSTNGIPEARIFEVRAY